MTKELIEKIEDAHRRVRKIGPDAIYETELREVLRAAADALAARQPSVIDRDAAIDAIAGGTISVPGGYGVLHGDDAENIVDAIIGLATVPDAATEELLKRVEEAEAQSAEDRVEWQQMKERASQRFNAYQQKKRELRQMEIRAEKAEAERDAALAAIERVTRAKLEVDSVHQFHGNDCLCGFSSARSRSRTEHITGALIAALDGAPEPETPELFPGTNAALDRLTVRKAAPVNAFCIEHGNFHAVELGDPTCEFEDGFGEPVEGVKP